MGNILCVGVSVYMCERKKQTEKGRECLVYRTHTSATHCYTLQHTATHCNTLQRTLQHECVVCRTHPPPTMGKLKLCQITLLHTATHSVHHGQAQDASNHTYEWLIHPCNMTQSFRWHDSFICVSSVMSRMWMSHVTYMNESCHMYEWVTSHIWMSHVKKMNESCHVDERVMSRKRMSLVVWVSVSRKHPRPPTTCSSYITPRNE